MRVAVFMRTRAESRLPYSIDFAKPLCQDANRAWLPTPKTFASKRSASTFRDRHRRHGCRRAADRDQSAVYRQLELAAERRRGHRAKFLCERFSFCLSAD